MKRLAIFALALAAIGCAPEKAETAEVPPTTTTTGSSGSTGLDEPKKEEPKKDVVGELSAMTDSVPKPGEEVAVIETKHGRMVIRFYSDKAPKHVENFKQLARKGFYDGTKFHRIMPKFMIQGGDPNSKDSDPSNDGMGGPGYQIDAEFNEIAHERGILSMARSSDPNSAGSQFFIVHQPSYQLDTQYTVFGRVVKDGTEKGNEEAAGLKVVDKIVSGKANGEIAADPVEMKISIKTWPIK
jgi:peptidyl-prolyl cis-trans isomerase B (cyclophilin B)